MDIVSETLSEIFPVHEGNTYAAEKKPYIIMASVCGNKIVLSVFRVWLPRSIAAAYIMLNHINNGYEHGAHAVINSGKSCIYRYHQVIDAACIKNIKSEIDSAVISADESFNILEEGEKLCTV